MVERSRPPGRWFEPLAEHMGPAYLRYSFTKGTDQEVSFLLEHLDLVPGARVLDAGCGPGRHARALASSGMAVIGLDVSEQFCALVRDGDPAVPVVRADVRDIPLRPAFDVVLCLCQGGFGVLGGPGSDVDDDLVAFDAMAAALRPGGALVLSAFSSYFQVRYQSESPDSTFDAATGVNHETTSIKDPAGRSAEVDLWTTGFTPRELRLMSERSGLEVEALWSVTPGAYEPEAPSTESPEFLLVARRR